MQRRSRKACRSTTKEKIVKIKEKQEETERVLSEIIDGIPENIGQKSTVDYFLKWLDQEMKVPDDTVTTASELSHMGEMLEQVYLQNHLVAVTEKKASVLGYARFFGTLQKSRHGFACCHGTLEWEMESG